MIGDANMKFDKIKKRYTSGVLGDISPYGGMSTRDLFEKHGIEWTDEYEMSEVETLFGDSEEMENDDE